MSYHVHNPEDHTPYNRVFGGTFPPYEIEITEDFLKNYPEFRQALDSIGVKLASQYSEQTVRGSKITGINFIGLNFNLDTGPERKEEDLYK